MRRGGSRLSCGVGQAYDATRRAGRFDERLKIIQQTARENPNCDARGLTTDALMTDMAAADWLAAQKIARTRTSGVRTAVRHCRGERWAVVKSGAKCDTTQKTPT